MLARPSLLAVCTLCALACAEFAVAQQFEPPLPDAQLEEDLDFSEDADDPYVETASFFQPQPSLLPPLEFAPAATPAPYAPLATGPSALALERQRRAALAGGSLVAGGEARTRVTTDTGSLLRKSPAALGTEVQRRTPVITEPRARGDRVGRLSASGSYWVPARIDLDTMVSKIDSRLVQDVVVIKGPYSVLYGPGFDFVDIDLLDSPRFESGYEWHGSTSTDYQTNGQQVYGRQALWGGGEDWGYRFSYGHRTGNDYTSGNGTEIPASYNSRTFDLALGYDLSPDRHLEVNVLRLDQTNVEFPGQAFDIDFLVTDGYEVEYVDDLPALADRFAIEAWYNRTRFAGSARQPSKRRTFPFYDFINFVGNTDVDSLSTGFSAGWTWGDEESGQTIAGADLRYVKQELNEISSGRIGFAIWNDRNAPIPDSFQVDPGLFVEHTRRFDDRLLLRTGARLDMITSDIVAPVQDLQGLGTVTPPLTLAQILGSDEYHQTFNLGSAYITANYDINDCWQLLGNAGYGSRAPILTELYAAQPFMFLLQNGLNTVTGDPRLKPEQRYQIDLGLRYGDGPLRGGITGFQAWIHDYITFENMRTFVGPGGVVEQVSLKYVNTDLATLTGGELYGEADATEMLMLFGTLNYTYGRDRTRNGTFATLPAFPGVPSMQIADLPRGFFSGVAGANDEPLPGIFPLASRVGLRLHEAGESPVWMIELSARLVARQSQVASSLLETSTPGFSVFDLRGTWYYTDDLLLVGGVENFTDRNYREHFDFRSANGIQMFQPGINVYAGVELNY